MVCYLCSAYVRLSNLNKIIIHPFSPYKNIAAVFMNILVCIKLELYPKTVPSSFLFNNSGVYKAFVYITTFHNFIKRPYPEAFLCMIMCLSR